MRILLLLLALCLLVACNPTAPPTPAADVPALQTEAAALHTVATARAALIAPTKPPVEATRAAVYLVWAYAAMEDRYGVPAPTRTALAATWQPAAATLTALPPSAP